MNLTPRIIGETIATTEWRSKQSGEVYVTTNKRIKYQLENNNSPEIMGILEAEEESEENSLSPQDQADLFAKEFMDTIGEELTPRQMIALMREIHQTLIAMGRQKNLKELLQELSNKT